MAWTETTDGGYTILTSAVTAVNDNEGGTDEYVAHSPVIDTKLYPNWEGIKFPCKVAVTIVSGGAAGVVDAFLQTSNGSATTGDAYGGSSLTPLWADAAALVDLGAGCNMNAVASSTASIDATDVKAPYARISLKVAGTTDIGDSAGRCTIAIAIPKEDGIVGNDLGGDGTIGVGPDPS